MTTEQDLKSVFDDFLLQVSILRKAMDETEKELLASIARDKQNRKDEVHS